MFEDIFGDFDKQIDRATRIDDVPVIESVGDIWQTDVWSTSEDVDPDSVWGRGNPDYVWKN